jgi:murein tripeptide amidase MpaA
MTSCATSRQAERITFENAIDTHDKPVTFQPDSIWSFGSLHVSNQFDGAGLYDVQQKNDSTFIAFIRPENQPINPSPWYAFKLKEDSSRVRYIILEYGDVKHRYSPKIERHGHYTDVDSTHITRISDSEVMIMIALDNEEVVLAGQSLAASSDVHVWMDSLGKKHNLNYQEYGKSAEGRPLMFLEIRNGKRHKPVIVLLCRQHPPEVTGWYALQHFLAEILGNPELSETFLDQYTLLVYPLLNPDGVDHGFWRHNTGGVDLNRDWSEYNQPEIRQTVDHIIKTTKRQSVVLALDFHSTYHDIFYTNDESLKPSALPAFKNQWIGSLRTQLPDLLFEERQSKPQTPVSKNWFYRYFNATAITYEIGDDTPPDIIALKGRTSARLMMQILVKD